MCMTQPENNLAFWLISAEDKLQITVKISIYFLSPIVFKTYHIQYRSKYIITEFWIFRYLELFLFVPWEFEIADVHYNKVSGKLRANHFLILITFLCTGWKSFS